MCVFMNECYVRIRFMIVINIIHHHHNTFPSFVRSNHIPFQNHTHLFFSTRKTQHDQPVNNDEKMSLSFRLVGLLSILSIIIQECLAKQRVLLYSKTAGFRHASIPNAIEAFEKLGKENGLYTYNTEDETKFEDEEWVNKWDAMVFISVSGTIFSNKGAVNMMKYIENGGGFMGIHEACDAMYKSPWYGRLVGAYFDYHPYLQRFTLDVETHNHPSTSFLGNTWEVYDEVYTFNSDPRKLDKQVVLTANPHSYKDPTGPGIQALREQEGKHPIAWYKQGGLLDEPVKRIIGGGVMDTSKTPKNQRGTGGDGRAFYTALGHTKSCWKKKQMIEHVWGGLQWVLDSQSIKSNNASLPSSAPGSAFIQNSTSTNTNASTSAGASATSSNSTSGGQHPPQSVSALRSNAFITSPDTFFLILPIIAGLSLSLLGL